VSNKNLWYCLKTIIFILCLSPFLILVYDVFYQKLGANPIETLHFRLGTWALRFICIGLTLTPLKRITKLSKINSLKRMLGLFAFFYASLHVLVYIGLDLAFSVDELLDEIPNSPYIIVGLIAYALLIPLAITSTHVMQKSLGRTWKTLHRLIYIIAILAVIHYLWMQKTYNPEPLYYAVIVSVLLMYRIIFSLKLKRKALFK